MFFSKQNAFPKHEMFGEVGMKLKWNFSWQVQALVKVAMMLECNFWWQVQFGYVGVQLFGATGNLLDVSCASVIRHECRSCGPFYIPAIAPRSAATIPHECRGYCAFYIPAVAPRTVLDNTCVATLKKLSTMNAVVTWRFASQRLLAVKQECCSCIAFCIPGLVRSRTAQYPVALCSTE